MTYTHEVRFTKVFTAGLLKGCIAEGESIKFCSVADAHAFIAAVLAQPHVRKPCAGRSPYRIEDPYLFCLD